MITPALENDAFLEDVRLARRDADTLHLWWLGQSGFLVHWNDRFILFDPYLSDSLTKKYAETEKPHVRMTRRVISPERLDFIDVVTSTHNHTDHLDAETLLPLTQVNPDLQMVIPEANRNFVAERLRTDPDWPVGLDDGQSVDVSRCRFHAVPAAHETVERDDQGRCRFLGYVVEIGPYTLYHSGDTMMFDGLAERLKAFSINVAMLPINGRDPKRGVPGNLSGEEAAELANAIGAGLAIPCHFEMFEFNTASPEPFRKRAETLGQPVRVLRAGERFSVSSVPGPQS